MRRTDEDGFVVLCLLLAGWSACSTTEAGVFVYVVLLVFRCVFVCVLYVCVVSTACKVHATDRVWVLDRRWDGGRGRRARLRSRFDFVRERET